MITLDEILASFHSIKISDGTNDLAIDASGYITANINGTVDAVQSGSWEVGLATGAVVGLTDGTDALAINTDGSVNVKGSLETFPGGYENWKVSAAAISATESQIVATPLSGRLRILVQNLGSNDVYLKEATGVTNLNGMKLPKGASFVEDLDDGAALYAVTAAGSSDLRIVEFAA